MVDADIQLLAATFERTVGDRLLAAERIAAWLPQLVSGALVSADLGYSPGGRFFVVVARTRSLAPEAEARFRYWCARAGGMPWNLTTGRPDESRKVEERAARCEFRSPGVSPAALPAAAARLANVAGAPADRIPAALVEPVLSMDAGSAAFATVSWDGAAQRLFIPGASAPPAGDLLRVALRVPGAERPLEARARVVEVRSAQEAEPGRPAGFAIAFEGLPPSLGDALSSHAAGPRGAVNTRLAPRYAVNAPVRLEPDAGLVARLEYGTPEELAADWVENLSQGGAFVRTPADHPEGTRLTLEMRLPGGAELRAPAVVRYRNPRGVGLQVELDEDGKGKVAAVLAGLAARPRRALLVDDDVLILRALGDALQAHGFEVLTAMDGDEGLHIVADELLTLDLLVTDIRMPNMDGETFVRTIRGVGGESELAIVVVAGTLDPTLVARMTAAGADAVLDKALGPRGIADEADAALERKRRSAAAT